MSARLTQGTLIVGLGLSAAIYAQGQSGRVRIAPEPPRAPSGFEYSSSTPLRDADLALLSELHHASQVMFDASRMTMESSKNRDIVRFSQRVMYEHQADMRAFESLVRSRGAQLAMPLATTPDELAARAEQQTKMARLHNARGEELDRSYLELVLEEHERSNAMARNGLDATGDEQVKSALGELLSSCGEHVAIAERLQTSLAHDAPPAAPSDAQTADENVSGTPLPPNGEQAPQSAPADGSAPGAR